MHVPLPIPPFKEHLVFVVDRDIDLRLVVGVAPGTTCLLYCHCIIALCLISDEKVPRVMEYAIFLHFSLEGLLHILGQREVIELWYPLGSLWVLANRD